MNTTTVVVAVWVVLGVATLILAIYREVVTVHQEEDVVRLGPGEEGEIPKQISLARRLKAVDRWGKIMTVAVTIIGLGLASGYLYQAWENPNPGPSNFYFKTLPDK
jgi:hypothetical protein